VQRRASLRKKDKEIKDNDLIEDIITRARVLRLGVFDGAYPYVVPMNFGYREGSFYLHSAREGKKIELLRTHPAVCVEIDLCDAIVEAPCACQWTTRYQSIVGFGHARFIRDHAEKRQGLDLIMRHYSGRSAYEYPDEILEKVEVVCIHIDRMTGKMSP